jgi:hypothetical protein
MNEYQLKLAKLYAELIGESPVISRNGFVYLLKGYAECREPLPTLFNPFIGQLQLDARDNFEVDIEWYREAVSMQSEYSDKPNNSVIGFDGKNEVPQAVIECILKSKGLIQ